MKCLVTGAAGFIGSALIKRLTNEDYEVRGLVHLEQPIHPIKNVEYIQGDIADKESIRSAVEGSNVVFHCAALVRSFGRKKKFYEVNYEGTKNLVILCEEYDVGRFVFLSHMDYECGKNAGYYSKTKKLAEQYLIEQHKEKGFPAIIIRPGNVYGPGATIWVLWLLEAIKKNRIALIDGGKGIFLHTYIDNLLDALILSMKEPKAVGKAIDITDGINDTCWGEYINSLARLAGKSPIKRNFSKNTALLLSNFMILLHNVFRIKPLVTPTAVHIFTNSNKVSIKSAKEILNYEPAVGIEEGMRQVENWIRSEGYID